MSHIDNQDEKFFKIEKDEANIVLNEAEETSTKKSTDVDSYFSEDEEILAGNGKIITSENDMAVIQNIENTVVWEVENYLKDDGKPKSKFAMKNDPPIFRISSSDGETAEFVVTDELAQTMSKVFENIHRSYYGISTKKNSSTDEVSSTIQNIQSWAIENKFKISITLLLIILFIVAPIIF